MASWLKCIEKYLDFQNALFSFLLERHYSMLFVNFCSCPRCQGMCLPVIRREPAIVYPWKLPGCPRAQLCSALAGESAWWRQLRATRTKSGPAWRQQTHQPWKTGNQQRWEHSGARVWPGSYFLEGFVSWEAGLHVLVNSSKFCNLGLGGASSEGQNSNLGKVVRLWIFTCSFLSRFILLF